MRLDVFLAERGFAPSRSRARMMIEAGDVSVNGAPVLRPSFLVEGAEEIEVTDSLRYVGRGGLKLEAALEKFSVLCEGCVALDVGASSGGFTDCLLQHGAAFVFAIDSGSGQLAPSLLNDPRVESRENCNARYLKQADFSPVPTLAAMDVSFISQTLIHPALADVLPEGGELITLIKPQFECGREAVGKGGIVKKPEHRISAIRRVFACARECGIYPQALIRSPIVGGDGNVEFLALFTRNVTESDEKLFANLNIY